MTATPEPWLTLAEAVTYSHCSERTLRRAYQLPEGHPGRLRAVKHLGSIKLRPSWIDEWITRTTKAA